MIAPPSLTRYQQHKETYQAYYQKNKSQILQKNIDWANNNFVLYTLNRIKQRAKRQNIPFSLTEADIIFPTHCPLLGTELIPKIGLLLDDCNTISIDRIDNSLGYVPGNIQILSVKANRMKNNASAMELETFCKNYLNLYVSKTYLGNTECGGVGSVHGSCKQSCQSGQCCDGTATSQVLG